MTVPRLLECVPNFSEGRRPFVIQEIVARMQSVSGVRVLDVSSGDAANRTVVTIAGDPEGVCEAAFRGVESAVKTIDMRVQEGVHPRIGAADVVPLVPLRGISMPETISLAHRLADRIGNELTVPVYQYAEAARNGRPRGLAALRRGQLHGLRTRLQDGSLPPDAGPLSWTEHVARSGATAVGARGFLVALNVTLDTDDIEVARTVARSVRSRGPVQRGPGGTILRDAQGRPMRDKGPFPGVRAIGWRIAEYGRAQVSMNLVEPLVLSLHDLLSHIEALVARTGHAVAGCELIGLVPEAVLARVGREAGASTDFAQAGFQRLRLDHLRPLSVEDVVLESRLEASGLV